MAIGNAFQIAALTMRPFSRKASAAVNSKVLAAVWGFIQFMLERRHRAIITFSGDRNDLPAAPSAFVVANHLFFCDFVLEHAVAIRRNMLGHCRYFSKESHKYWPLFGWLIRLAGFVLLKRDWEQDQAMIKYRIQQWKNDEQPIWMVVYPEGTRQTPEKLAASQAYSKKHDRPVFKHLLYPRTKGFISVVKQLRESHFQYVLDFTVACYHIPTKSVNTRFPSGFDLLSKRLDSTYRFHVHVDAHQLDSIPTDDEGTEQWLVDRWVEKDARLARWHQKWPRVVPGAANMLGHEDAMDVPWPWLKWQDFQREI
ncbi:hypothetical protein BC828DRAFT_351962 [Blastocladiella britannica]|nr:hypothetical protein BC828DRAFT_351962 [Blastocladiella britannica]